MLNKLIGAEPSHTEHDETAIRLNLDRLCGEAMKRRESDGRSLADEWYDLWLKTPDLADHMVNRHFYERLSQIMGTGPGFAHTISVHITDHGWFSIKYKHTAHDTIIPVITAGFHKDMRPEQPE